MPRVEVWQHRLRVVDDGEPAARRARSPRRGRRRPTSTPPSTPDAPCRPPRGPVPAAVVAVDGDEMRATVLGLVADKTGYPPDMLDVDLDLEADLGVDTVKQAELFATIREHFRR